MNRTLPALLAAAAILVAGCSSAGTEPTATATSPASTSASDTSTAPSSVTVEAVAETESTGDMKHGLALYAETCTGSLEFFQEYRTMAESFGEEWDPDVAAEWFMGLVTDPEAFEADLEAGGLTVESGDSDGPDVDWDTLSSADQEQVRRAVYAASNGEC